MKTPALIALALSLPAAAFAAGDFALDSSGAAALRAAAAAAPSAPGRAVVSRLDQDLGVLQTSKDLAARVQAMKELAQMGALAPDEELRAAAALQAAADSATETGAIRARALLTLGEMAENFQYSAARQQAVDYLTTVAGLQGGLDSRAAYRREALMGLSHAIVRVPWTDDAAAEKALTSAFDAYRDSSNGADRFAALMVLRGYVRGHGLGVMENAGAAQQRLESDLLQPLRGGGLQSYYGDASRNPVENRELTIVVLASIMNSRNPGPFTGQVRFECRGILDAMGEAEPVSQLRQLARRLSRGGWLD